MIYSMTGFGRSSIDENNYGVSVEIKTVNNKYLDVQVKNPNFLNFLEENVKKTVRKNLNRGRVDVFIRCQKKESNISKMYFDSNLVSNYMEAVKDLEKSLDYDFKLKLSDIMLLEGALQIEECEEDENILKELILTQVENALKLLIDMRKKEGENISEIIKIQLDEMKVVVKEIKDLAESSHDEYKESLIKKLQDLNDEDLKIDMDRIYLEVALYGERSDITEEIVRLNSHIDQFLLTLESNKPKGRKLDFIVQEMNREVNTISSKSPNKTIVQNCIELKSIIEKIREQIQNIE